MIDLTKQEKLILLFLTATFLTGTGLKSYRNSQTKLNLTVQPAKVQALQNIDNFIEQKRFVNINSLEIEELTRLPGVGEKIAERIIQHHQSHGPFMSKEELMQVKGIGEKRFEQIKHLLTLE